MKLITPEYLFRFDRLQYPKYKTLSRKVAQRLCNGEPLPKPGYERKIAENEKGDILYLCNMSGSFRTWVYYPVNRRG